MATAKTTTINFCIEPGLKEALRTTAKHEPHSITTQVEVFIRDYCSRNGIDITESPMPNAKSDSK